jgi:YVTN family beta-propeller protein
LAKAGVGFAQCLLGVDLQKTSQVHDCEEEIAEFMLYVLLVAGVPCGGEFARLFFNLCENSADLWPFEAYFRGFGADLVGLHQSGKSTRYSIEKRLFRGCWLLLLLDFVPALLYVFGGFGCAAGEDMRMTTDQFLVDGVKRIANVEQLRLGGHRGEEDRLQQQIAELFREGWPVTLVDCVQHLVSFFQQIGLDGVEGLLAVPWATARRPQPGHHVYQFGELFSGFETTDLVGHVQTLCDTVSARTMLANMLVRRHSRASRFWVACLGGILAASSGNSSAPASGGLLLVANKGAHTLGIVDPAGKKQVAEVPENGITGHEVVASPDGRTAYVPIYGNSGVGKPGTDGNNMVVIDIATQKIKGDVTFDHAVRPHCPVFGPKDGLLYVTTELDKTISIIDPATLKIIGTIPTGQPESHMLAISHDGRRGYTANVGAGTVSVLDMEARKTIAVIPISSNTQRISVSPDDRMVFTSDQTTPRLAVIDAATDKVKKWVALPASGYGTAPTTDGRYLLVAVPQARKVAVVDLRKLEVVHTIDVPAAPQEVLVRPDNKVAYVSCDAEHKIAAINIGDWTVDSLIDTGRGTDGLAWAKE